MSERKKEQTDSAKKAAIRRRVLIAAAVVAAVIAVVCLALDAWTQPPPLPDVPVTPLPDESASSSSSQEEWDIEAPDIVMSGRKQGIYTFLVVGKDVVGGGTDTMLLLSYDTTNKSVIGLNLPRDTMVNTSASINPRLNAVYAYNMGRDKETQVEKGIAALKEQAAKLTGITPDYYVLVEWEAIGKLVDAVGGVEFEVPFLMDYKDPYQNLVIYQEPGKRLLSGSDAMQVIRWRQNSDGSHSAGGDIARLSIQQDFLKAVVKKCLQPATFLKIPSLAEIFTENVKTDLSVGNILAFARLAAGMDPDEGVHFQTAPIAKSFMHWNGSMNLALITLDAGGILEIVNGGMNPYLRDVTRNDLQVIIRNGDGSYSVTSGALENKRLAAPGAGIRPKPPEPEEPEEPEDDPPQEGDIQQPGTDPSGPPEGPEDPAQPDPGQEQPGGEPQPGGPESTEPPDGQTQGEEPPVQGDGEQQQLPPEESGQPGQVDLEGVPEWMIPPAALE